MSYSIKYSPEALDTFNDIKEQINARWGDKYVQEFKRRSVKVIETIRESPFAFQSIHANKNVRRKVIHKNISVFYEVESDSISILFFWDNRQDPIFI
ncbi:MAG: type II toxin-antitoxin system RelE/ParE family toxin [Bacteroidota bacterium]